MGQTDFSKGTQTSPWWVVFEHRAGLLTALPPPSAGGPAAPQHRLLASPAPAAREGSALLYPGPLPGCLGVST